MQAEIHPTYRAINVECSCGNHFSVHSTYDKESLHTDVCSKCHPFYTGQQKIATAGRVDSFYKKYKHLLPAKEERAS